MRQAAPPGREEMTGNLDSFALLLMLLVGYLSIVFGYSDDSSDNSPDGYPDDSPDGYPKGFCWLLF